MNTSENKKLWFRAKRYGWGWTPCTWQGWTITLGYVAIVTALAFASDMLILSPFLIVPMILVLTFALITIAQVKGEAPRWRWGSIDFRNRKD